jgi:hypothetical protein
MVIYTNNLAEKLFGFAMSREQLRDTALCGFLDDPRLTLDIDLAIDFNAAVRGDEDAAERFTNTLILSSAYVDYSTADFYTTRMEQYPVFEYHVDRITYIFDNLDNLGDYYANSNANERSFLDKLLDALKDCLNSPCNLFAASSESMASITDMAAKSNSSTIPSFQELKGKFKNAYGGLKTTLVKRLPDAVSDMFIELGTIGQGAWAQSVDMLYSKDPEKKKKIISNALAGKALDSDSTSYSYIPDLDAYTSVEGFATSVLSQAASDLGGCFRKYQHLARYSPFNPDQNLSITNKDPVSDKVDGIDTSRNSFGVYSWDFQNRDLNTCRGGLPGSATPDVTAPGSVNPYTGGGKGSKAQYERIKQQLQGSSLIGKVPKDGAKYGITTGSIEEWAQFFTSLANVESGFRHSASFRESFGVMSEGVYSLTVGEKGLTKETIFNPDINTQAAINIFEDNFLSSKNPERYIGNYQDGRWVGGSAYWGPLRTSPDKMPGRDKREQNDLNIKPSDYK